MVSRHVLDAALTGGSPSSSRRNSGELVMLCGAIPTSHVKLSFSLDELHAHERKNREPHTGCNTSNNLKNLQAPKKDSQFRRSEQCNGELQDLQATTCQRSSFVACEETSWPSWGTSSMGSHGLKPKECSTHELLASACHCSKAGQGKHCYLRDSRLRPKSAEDSSNRLS